MAKGEVDFPFCGRSSSSTSRSRASRTSSWCRAARLCTTCHGGPCWWKRLSSRRSSEQHGGKDQHHENGPPLPPAPLPAIVQAEGRDLPIRRKIGARSGRNRSGSLAMFAAIRRVCKQLADRRPGLSLLKTCGSPTNNPDSFARGTGTSDARSQFGWCMRQANSTAQRGISKWTWDRLSRSRVATPSSCGI